MFNILTHKKREELSFYTHSTAVSCKQRITQRQFKSIVKKEFVATYGTLAVDAGSVLGAKTRKVAQLPSNFSTRKTLEQFVYGSLQSIFSFEIGIFHGVPLPQQVYNITGLVLQTSELAPHPKNPLSQVSRQFSEHSAFCCKILMTVKISAMQLQFSSFLLLHIL